MVLRRWWWAFAIMARSLGPSLPPIVRGSSSVPTTEPVYLTFLLMLLSVEENTDQSLDPTFLRKWNLLWLLSVDDISVRCPIQVVIQLQYQIFVDPDLWKSTNVFWVLETFSCRWLDLHYVSKSSTWLA